VASRLGGSTGAQLRSAATHAYLTSMRVTYAISVFIVVTAIGVAYRYLPARARPAATDDAYSESLADEGLLAPEAPLSSRSSAPVALDVDNVAE
jgi:hypothetical protein